MNQPPPAQTQISGFRAFLMALLALSILAFGALIVISAAVDLWAWSTVPSCPRTMPYGN